MYEVKGKHWVWMNGQKVDPAPTQTFKSAMEMLHWAFQAGAFTRSVYGNDAPTTLEMAHISYSGGPGYGASFKWFFTPDQVQAMRTAMSRYLAILRYFRETEPEWREVKRTHYADNSTEAVQEDKYGNRRTVMLKYPHGDVCF